MNDIDVVVGRLGKPHGIRGELTVDVRTDEPDRRFAPGARLRAESQRGAGQGPPALTVAAVRWHQGVLLARFEEVDDRTAAEALRGVVLHATIAAGEGPEDPEEFYAHQLEGLTAYDEHDRLLGTVSRLVPGSAQDLLEIRTVDGRDALVPFVTALVPEVDLAAGRLVIADRPGLVAPFEGEDETP